ncbi:hypothetical protein [Streptomyces sp. NPDC058964]|uniref:hypothetical protein n=1 Tax=Streptomyces sp. NPDC058964 TaxID=3346681 RepID=UPI0036AA6793
MSKARHLLSTGPFGAAAGIHADMATFSEIAAELLHAHTGLRPPSPAPDAALIAHSVARSTTLDAFRALHGRGDPADAARILRRGAQLFASAAPHTQLTVPGHTYALAGDWSAVEGGRALRAVIGEDLAVAHSHVAATPDHVTAVGRGLRLIEAAVGEFGLSIVSSVRGAVLIEDSIIESAFIVPAPFVSVLNTQVLASPLKTADAVLHEAAHQKFYDLLVCRRLVNPDYNYLGGALFGIPWNPVAGERRRMDCLRVLSTIHVYAHLLELLLSVREAGLSDRGECDGMLTEYWQRAQFFDTAVRSGVVRTALGPDARAMVDWLASVMDVHRETLAAAGRDAESPYTADALEQVHRFEAEAAALV